MNDDPRKELTLFASMFIPLALVHVLEPLTGANNWAERGGAIGEGLWPLANAVAALSYLVVTICYLRLSKEAEVGAVKKQPYRTVFAIILVISAVLFIANLLWVDLDLLGIRSGFGGLFTFFPPFTIFAFWLHAQLLKEVVGEKGRGETHFNLNDLQVIRRCMWFGVFFLAACWILELLF